MATNYSRGRAFEYAVKNEAQRDGFLVVRSAGSHGPIDLVCISADETRLVSCKKAGYWPREELIELKALQWTFRVKVYLASKVGKGIKWQKLK